MNNFQLLTGVLMTTLAGSGVCSYAQNVYTLEQLFESAEANNLQLHSYLTSQQEAEQEIKIADTERLPEIEASLSLSYLGNGFTTDRKLSDFRDAPIPHLGNGIGLKLYQPLYSGGAITSGRELARLKSTAKRFTTELKRDNIRFKLAGFYLDIYKYTNIRQIVHNNVTRAQLVLNEMKARYEQGVVLQNDITRYELLISNLELQLTKINNIIEILNNNLVVTAGLPDGTKVSPDSTILNRALPLKSENDWQSDALISSPTIRLADLNVRVNKKAESIVKSNRLPKIGLQAGWNIDGPILVEVPPIDRNLSYWYVGLGMTYNISSLYKNNKALTKSRLATREAVERLDATRQELRLSIQNEYIRYLEAFEEVKTMQKSVGLAENNYQIISTRFKAEMALITDMLDAANSRLDAELQLVNAQINIIYSYYKLLFISGKI